MGKRDIKVFFIILILIFAAYLLPLLGNRQEDPITVFVIDSFDNNILSHGDIVSLIIERAAPDFKIIKRNIKKKDQHELTYYYQALEEIYQYKLDNLNQEVIVNISLGFYDKSSYHERLIKNLNNLEVGIVAAAGNDDSPLSFYPAAFKDHVIAVASVDGRKKTSYSNYGEYIDICADGSFFTTLSMPQFISYRASGTSFAAPRVSAFLAKIISKNEQIDFKEAVNLLKEITVSLNDPLYSKGLLGEGKVSNLKYLLKYDINKLLYLYILPMVVFILLSYLVIKKMGYIGIHYLILVLIVGGPVFLILQDYFIINISQYIFTVTNLKYLMVLTVIYFIVKRITNYERYFILKVILFINMLVVFIFNLLNIDKLLIFSVLNIFISLLFIFYEKYLINKYKNSTNIGDLLHFNLKSINLIKSNIINKKENLNENEITRLYKIYSNTDKVEIKRAVIEILTKKENNLRYYYLFKYAKNSLLEKDLIKKIDHKKEKIDVRELFKIAEERKNLIKSIFNRYSFDQIEEGLKREFSEKKISLETLIEIVLYYNKKGFRSFLIEVYDNYDRCWDRLLLFRVIVHLTTKKDIDLTLDLFKDDKCGLVLEEINYITKKRRRVDG
ncbi:MAG: S8/S53 family peptidase [Halanaerobiales bacterium]|nr:S8/S53 family peptidase [Halanaerobiales bacterium]